MWRERIESAINAKEVEIKFNKAIDPSTVLDGAVGSKTLKDGVFSFTAIDSATSVTADSAVASLSQDGKTLTVTANTKFDGKYAVTINSGIKTVDNKNVAAYTNILNVNDDTRPVLKEVTYVDASTAKLVFSEPLSDEGNVSFSNNDAALFTSGDHKFVAGSNELYIDLSSVNNTDNITVSIVGAKDYNNNLISPNPVTATVKKDDSDKVKPTVTNIEALGLNKFKVTFSEQLKANPVFSVDGTTAVGTVAKDSTGLSYTFTLTTPVAAGLHTIEATTFADKSNNPGVAYSKVLNFAADSIAPEVVSTSVEKISGKEYLVVNYSEDVTPVDDKDITGTFVKDYVEKAITIVTDTNSAATAVSPEVNGTVSLHNAVNGVSKSIKIDLTNTSSGAYNVSLPTGLVTDGNNVSKSKSVSFTRTTDVDTTKPELDTTYATNGIKVEDNNTLTVKFNKKLDVTSALNASNYVVDGVAVTKAIFTQNDATGAIVKLTLADDSVKLSGDREIKISNVKSSDGVVMETVRVNETLKENVKPVVSTVALVGADKIKVTFSEALATGTLDKIEDKTAGSSLAGDFEVLVGNVSEAGANVAIDSSDTTNKTYIITLANDLTAAEYANTITLKAGTDLNVTDVALNALSFTSATVTK